MGAVYQGVQLSLGRDVAIKLLPPELGSAPEFEARFKREANAMARLNHPNIVQIFDYGQTVEGHHYIVMEYVDGMDLHRLIHSGGLDAIGALNAVSQICDALEYAHAEGFIHRDIKPANIFINHKGILKIGDFGLAKLIDPDQKVNDSDPSATRTDVVMGTPNYIAPEQWTATSKVDHRADIYSLGVMFYEMLTGTIPRGAFRAPSERVKTLDVRIDGVVFKAMESDPNERYQSAADLRSDVDVIRTTPDAKPPAKKPTGKRDASQAQRPGPLVAVATVSVLLAIGLGLMAVRPWEPGKPSRLASAERSEPESIPAATKEAPFVNTLGMKFVPVPGTKVLFCIHETRVKDFALFAKAKTVNDVWTRQHIRGVPISYEPENPAPGMNWYEARAFCRWLTEKERSEGKLSTGLVYRLPTDQEWSYAVGIGTLENRTPETTPEMLDKKLPGEYPWGGTFPPKTEDLAGNYGDLSYHELFPDRLAYLREYRDGFPTTAPVMSFKPNSLGLYDLGGNVWEWVEDWSNKEQKTRVIRGASFDGNDSFVDGMLSSSRRLYRPEEHINFVGFRCVLGTSAPEAAVVTAPSGESKTSDPAPASATFTPSGSISAATKDAPFTNTLGMKFVPVPGTEILMCIHETRKGDYAAFVRETLNGNTAWQTSDVLGVPIGMTNDHPVICVSWPEAKAFCAWLSRREGRVYRLPTDWEWSHAVGVGKVEPPGVTPASLDARLTSPVDIGAENLFDLSCKERFPNRPLSLNSLINDGFPTTAPVMSFRPNALGIYDLKGNVWEYCEDFYDERRASHVIRGNCWNDAMSNWSTRGGGRDPFTRHNVDGFRCVLVPSGSPLVTMRVDLPVPAHHAVGDPQRYGLSRYQFFSGSINWAEARGVAERLGGHLATLTSKAESDWVKATFGKHVAAPNQSFWLGGYALQAGNAWRWITEEALIQTDWFPGEPNAAGGEEGKEGPPFFLSLSQATDGTQGWADRGSEPERADDSAGFLVEWDDPFGDPLRLATTAPTAEPFTNSLGMRFVPVPGTRILLCVHETRKGDYAAYARETEGVDGSWSNPNFQGVPVSTDETHPVVMVNWFEARAFCEWLSRKEGRNYRLPTDREWSVAVGIGDREDADASPEYLHQQITDHWPWGTSQPVPSGVGNYADSVLKAKLPLQNTIKDFTDGFAVTAPVMRFPPNSLGLFDLGGNMAEWCEDGLNKDRRQRVLRGGSWFDGGPPYSSVRFRDFPGSRRFYFGFRCAVEVGDRGNGASP
jgi:formylglycine-generating enzyme required for sulfatase activity/serine/threonine protein kinase